MFFAVVAVLLAIIFLFNLFQPAYVPRLIDKLQGKLPPGPFGWPITGATGISCDAPWETLTSWASKYGPVISFFNGSEFTIALSDSDVIKAALRDPVFDGRPLNHSSKQYFSQGIGFAENDTWKTHRKLVVSSMRHLTATGEAQEQFSEHLTKCANRMVETLTASPKTFDPSNLVMRTVADALGFLIFKDALSSDDPRFDQMIDCCERVFSVNPSTDIMNTFPILRHLPQFQQQHEFFADTHKELFHITESVVKARKSTMQHRAADETAEFDFTEAMLLHQIRDDVPGHHLSDEEIKVMATELYMAGIQDTKNVFHWIFLLLIWYPEVQSKMRNYIDDVFPDRIPPHLSDKSKLSYVDAFVLEVQRFSSSMPFPLPHRVVKDTVFMDYKLPADSAVIVNAFAVNVSGKLWQDPDVFRPERFLDSEGKLNSLCSRTIGFGEGRRSCPGELIARLTLMVLVSSIVQQLVISHPPGSSLPAIVRSNGTASQPPYFEILVQPRESQ